MNASSPVWRPFAVIGLSLTLANLSYAGSFSTDFGSGQPPGSSVNGSAFVDSTGGAGDNGGVLKLTTATPSQLGSFILDDLDPGERIGSFVVRFNLHLGNGSTPPADGISFNFATDLPNNIAFDEEGAGSGLTITFDCFDNSTDNNAEGPEFRIKVGGSIITRRKISTQFQTGTGYVPVVITYTSAGTLALSYNNQVLFTNLFVFSPLGTGARFGFGARTGGSYQEQFVDDLNITTSTIGANGFYIKGQVTPYPPVGISGASSFLVQFQDNGLVADPNSVTMTFNGATVSPSVSKPAGITTISYAQHGLLLPTSVNHMAINFSLSGNPTTLLYDFAVTNAPLWSLAPLSRSYLQLDTDLVTGTTPLYRSIALNPLTNHLYIVSRALVNTGLSIRVLDAKTGADLWQLNTNGIATPSAGFILMNIAAADDGAFYAASITAAATSPQLVVYRWANDSSATLATVVYSGDPGASIAANKRWGDTLAARGAGPNTQLILDCNGNAMSAILNPTDTSWVSNFVATVYNDSYTTASTAIGRSIQFGPTNTFWLKKRSSTKPTQSPVPALPLALWRNDGAPNTTSLASFPSFYGEVGPLALDLSRNLAAGIMFVTNAAAADHLVVYDISNLASPLPVAQYDFPVLHQANNNYIGQVVIGSDQIYAVDGNNGIMAVPIVAPSIPVLKISASGGSAVLSWTNTVPGFVLQSTTDLLTPAWAPVAHPVLENGPLNSVTDTPTSPTFYRLLK